MKKIYLIALLFVVGVAGWYVFTGESQDDLGTEETQQKIVATSLVGDLEIERGGVTAYGQVVSSDSVSVVPERAGVVRSVNARLGDVVRAGQVIVELQNSSEQQAVLQAQASLASAQASLQNTTRDADAEQVAQAEAQISSTQASLALTESNILAGLDQMYSQIDGLVFSTFSEFFNNPGSDFLLFKIDQLDDESVKRVLEQSLKDLNNLLDQDRNYPNPILAIEAAMDLLVDFDLLVQQLKEELSVLEPSASLSAITLERWQRELTNSKNSSQSLRVTLNRYRSELNSAIQAVSSAQVNLTSIKDGANSQDITIAQSSVTSARAGLASAQIELAKTRIAAPTFGRISSIETRVGELVGPQSPIFIISSTGSKRVDVFVSEQEARAITVGARVLINSEIPGTVSRVSPSINTETGKIKVEIFPDQQLDLTEGSGVRVSIGSSSESDQTMIPISAVFVRSGISYVYVVRDGTALVQPIETRGLFGTDVEVLSGLNPEDRIIINARAVSDNESVDISSVSENQEENTEEVINQ